MVSRRDAVLLGSLFLVIAALFAPLLLRPGLMPGNFGDLYSYHYPLRHLVTSRLQQGQAPLWNPYIFAGVPLAANPQSLLLYPLAQLHYFLPLSWAFSLDAFFHVCLAALGAYLLLKTWGLERGGAVTLAAAYALSPFLIYRVPQGVPTHLAALAWAPWIWLAALTRHPLLLSVAFALQVLSGHPQFALINAIGLGIWAMIVSPRRAAALVPAALLGLFLAAAQVGPTLEYLRQSIRAVWEPFFSLGYSLKSQYLLTLAWPRAFGDPFQHGFALKPSEFFEMLGLYLGLVPLALAAVGLARVRSRAAAGAWLMIAAGLFLALGANNPLYVRCQSVLALDFLRVPARFSFLILWGLWLAAALGFARVARKRGALFKAFLAALTVLDLGVFAARWIYAQEPRDFLAPQPEITRLLRQGPRVATAPEILAADKTMLYRLRNVTGYEAFYPARIAFYTARSEGGPAADGSRTYVRRWRSPEMAKLGVRYYVATAPEPEATAAFQRGQTFIYENPQAGPLATGAESLAEPAPEHLVARTSAAVPLILRQQFYPGWRAFAAGKEQRVIIRDGLFPAVAAGEAGRTVHFKFMPESWRLGLLVSLVTGFLFLGMAELRLRAWKP